MRMRAPPPGTALLQMPQRRLQMPVVPSADLDGPRVGIFRLYVVPVDESGAGSAVPSEEATFILDGESAPGWFGWP